MEVKIDKDKLLEDLRVELINLFHSEGVQVSDENFRIEDGKITMPHYYQYLETGTAPTGSLEQRDAIAWNLLESGWVSKKLGLNTKEGKQAAFAIGTSISRKGSKRYQSGGHPFINEGISNWLDQHLENYILLEDK